MFSYYIKTGEWHCVCLQKLRRFFEGAQKQKLDGCVWGEYRKNMLLSWQKSLQLFRPKNSRKKKWPLDSFPSLMGLLYFMKTVVSTLLEGIVAWFASLFRLYLLRQYSFDKWCGSKTIFFLSFMTIGQTFWLLSLYFHPQISPKSRRRFGPPQPSVERVCVIHFVW